MEMQTHPIIPKPRTGLKVFLWVLVALYTFILPDAILVYRYIVGFFGQGVAGKVPLIIVAIAGIAYVLAVLSLKKSLKNLLYLVPCGVIAFLIMSLEANPNKHIHIPEYVLMTWLLYAVLSMDYKGSGILILVFIYASLLGVVDELEQGINPTRFYGLSDMLVNSASALIGVFTIMGLKKRTSAGWAWTSRMKEFKALLGLSLFGFIGAVAMCGFLFQVQASADFWSVYPGWLWTWNILFLIMTPIMITFYQVNLRKNHVIMEDKKGHVLPPKVKTAHCWIFPLLGILFYMHALVIYISISDVKFS
jgi:VanZ family protein